MVWLIHGNYLEKDVLDFVKKAKNIFFDGKTQV